jgi:hypothetical protein
MAPSPKALAKAVEAIREAELPLERVKITQWLRICDKDHKNGLGFSVTASSRFSDPRPVPKFGLIYLAKDFTTAVAEAIIRDRKDGIPGLLTLSYEEAVGRWAVHEISSVRLLRVVNLIGVKKIALGVPSDILLHSNHGASQELSLAIHDHKAKPDGILYSSRFTGEECLALYGRGIYRTTKRTHAGTTYISAKVTVKKTELLSNLTSSLAPIFEEMGVQVAP